MHRKKTSYLNIFLLCNSLNNNNFCYLVNWLTLKSKGSSTECKNILALASSGKGLSRSTQVNGVKLVYINQRSGPGFPKSAAGNVFWWWDEMTQPSWVQAEQSWMSWKSSAAEPSQRPPVTRMLPKTPSFAGWIQWQRSMLLVTGKHCGWKHWDLL